MNEMYNAPDPAGASDPSAPGSPDPARRKNRLRWAAGVTLAAFLAGGGITLALVSGGGGALASPASSANAAQLNTELSAAASTAGTVPAARVRWALARLRLLGGVDGTVVFHNKTGFHTLSFERGTVQSASGSDVVIKAPDGTTWTWLIVSDTVVRKNGAKTTTSALSPGELVFAGGPVVSGARDARLVIVRTPGTPAPQPAGSQTAQTSLELTVAHPAARPGRARRVLLRAPGQHDTAQ
jgi:hypothetical protein